VIPLHPRTRDALERERLTTSAWKNLKVTEPVGYLDMIMLEKNARIILTDSGGVQKEAFFFQVPCLTLRERTEWKELVNTGWNVLVDANNERLFTEVKQKLVGKSLPTTHPDFYGTGNAGVAIITIIKDHIMEAVHA
jgi:UDP-N-acetylglucosamine 2-epimerase